MEIPEVIQLVDELQRARAHGALVAAGDKSAYLYGEACGFYRACETIKMAINERLEQEDAKEMSS